ncbi:death-inducer obliterator 1-like [Gouania willdenowi]|uniref:death-inducer obliterator 1-like n=1 Tax=Gouania willdenowi TaxID=441366 RepID=UPI0010565859|nr:death-inducer obliterator 1-like [Gouania willdenowi]
METQQDPQEIVSEEKATQEALPVLRRTKCEPIAESEHEAKMEMESSGPICIGHGCSKQALSDSVYCSTDCIIQHASFTMKTLSVPKVPKARGRGRKNLRNPRPEAVGRSRMSKRLSAKAEDEHEEEQMRKEDKDQETTASTEACEHTLSEAQTPSSKLYTSSQDEHQEDHVVETPSKHCPSTLSSEAASLPQPEAEAPPLQTTPSDKPEQAKSGKQKQKSRHVPSLTPTPMNTGPSPSIQSPAYTLPRHLETGALMASKRNFVIPKKPSVSGQPPTSTSHQKPSAPALLSETRNLPVPPAPSAPSSRPSQPNKQVRQSIQRSLTGILFKRVCDFEDLDMPESEVAKLVASIETEMFDIFRNTDSKYMNKYRTIMFNLKDPRNTGLLYRVIHGEIGPFRLVRMSQKDMQATKGPEPSAKETPEVKGSVAKAPPLQTPEAVMVDLPSLNSTQTKRKQENMEQKKNPPAPLLKTKNSQPSARQAKPSAVPDVLSCMLKDTTSEHKSHLFDLKCKICTGQKADLEVDEPAKKKPKMFTSRERKEPFWRKSSGDDSPLLAPPDLLIEMDGAMFRGSHI